MRAALQPSTLGQDYALPDEYVPPPPPTRAALLFAQTARLLSRVQASPASTDAADRGSPTSVNLTAEVRDVGNLMLRG